MKSEFATWREELNPPPRLSVAERWAAWFNRPEPVTEPSCPYVWRDPSVLFEEMS